MSDLIDLRSDTVTLPTKAMLRAMADAELGDDSRDGDPTVRRLEQRMAERLGKEAGLLVPSGTMGNLVALMTHGERGGEVLFDTAPHALTAEMGGVSAVAGLLPRSLPGSGGRIDLAALHAAVKGELTPKSLRTSLVWIENTHGSAGGLALPADYTAAVADIAHGKGVGVHLDGARLFNASVALGVDAASLAAPTDSVMVCLSKGLSAPIGSVVVGGAGFIGRARAFRRMLGGNMRQAGIIAAAGLVALENMVDRLVEDHATARRLAEGIAQIDPRLVDLGTVQTNMVRIDLDSPEGAASLARELARAGILVRPSAGGHLRFVTHRHITNIQIDTVIEQIGAILIKDRRRS